MPFAWAAGISAVGSIASGVIGASAAESAAQTQANAANNATAVEQAQFAQTTANEAPFLAAGNNSLAALLQGLGLGTSTNPGAPASGSLTKPFSAAAYQQSPGYQFQMAQGLNAVQNAASTQGGPLSGNALKALTTYGQGLANSDYQQAYANYVAQQQQQYNQLSGVANNGQNAATNLGSVGATTAGQVGSNILGAGNAQAAGTIGSANAIGGAASSIGSNALLYSLLNNSSGAGIFGNNTNATAATQINNFNAANPDPNAIV